MGRVRSFTADDIPEVVRLRDKCFSHSTQRSVREKHDYFQRIFFDNPWCNDNFPSLVFVDDEGTIVSFLGTIPRPIRFQGENLWMATPTQLMSDPSHRGMSGFALMKAFLAGQQDFSLADIAASGPRQIWERLGGTTATLQSLFWTQPLRPCRLALRDFGPSVVGKVIAKLALPFSAVLDFSLTRTPGNVYCRSESGLQEVRLELPDLLACYQQLENRFSLVPAYELDSLQWLFRELGSDTPGVDLRGASLRDAQGDTVGWYLYYPEPGGIARTVQVGARPEDQQRVLQHLFHDAWTRGCVAISGRLQPEFLSSMGGPPGRLVRNGPWTLVHSKNKELLRRVCDGDAWLTRMEGEWWLNF